MRKLIVGVIALLALLLPLRLFAQAAIWQDVSPNSITTSGKRLIVPDTYRTVRLNRDALMEVLARAPMEFTAAAKNNPVLLSIPMPDGKMAHFRINQSPISAPNRDGKPSTFQSYSGQGTDDRTATLRCDISPAGFHAQILSGGESVYVDPFAENDLVNCISYYRRDLRRQGAAPECFFGLPESFSLPPTSGRVRPSIANGSVLRTVRSAFAATAEYTTFFRQAGDSDAQAKDRALVAIKVTLNRVNGIWEKDAAVRYVLLADPTELTIIYTDPNTDPYTNDNASTMLGENQTSLDAVIGDANYDIGHVFATSAGGVGAGGVCVTGNKARGVTGLPMPVGDPFDVDFVAHEVVHQWAGNHTFNAGMGGNCTAGNRNAATAWEPGSGGTLASYAGICGDSNLQKNSDDHFHGGTILEILDWLTNTATCAGQVPNGNTPPTVTVPASFTIPRNTPFTLTASGSDPDGDMLTYTWEEFDLGAASPPETDDGTRPILRPFKPTTSPSKTFPSLTYILNNANNPPPT
ncbi:MAG: zinc-dependent metalloprotease family protein, partial [Chthoniobacterales bacterium]